MLQVSVKVSGGQETAARLTKLGQNLYLFKSAMESIGKATDEYFSSFPFTSQGGVFNDVWASLNAKYRLSKAKKYPGAPPLVASGKMKKSFTYSATNTGVTISNTADYFKYHQSTEARHKIPRRPMIEVNNAVLEIIGSIIQADIQKKIKAVQL